MLTSIFKRLLIKQPITLYKKCCIIITLIDITTYIFIYYIILTPLIKISGSIPEHSVGESS
jgi:hypothetical protein